MKLGGEGSDHDLSPERVQYQYIKLIFSPLRGWCRFMSIFPRFRPSELTEGLFKFNHFVVYK